MATSETTPPLGPTSASAGPASPSTFLWSFSVTAAICFVAIVALNWGVDPYDQYGEHGLAPLTRSVRGLKARALTEASADVDGLVLGSSRVLTLSPERLSHRSGTRYYNAGVYFGRTEDFLAIYRSFREANGRAPASLVIGLDIDALAGHTPPDPELLRTATLRDQAPECFTFADRLQPVGELLSWHQTASALKSVAATFRGTSPQHDEHFATDGSIVYERRDRELAAGDYDWRAAYDYDAGVYARLYRQYDRLSPRRVAAWVALMQHCDEDGVRVTVFLTPTHPELLAELRESDRFEARRAEVAELARNTLPAASRFVDLTEIDSFGGDPEQFYDAVHLRADNAARLVDSLFKPNGDERYAVQ